MITNITSSSSKILGFLIFFVSIAYAYKYQNPDVLENGIMWATILIVGKTASQAHVDASKKGKR